MTGTVILIGSLPWWFHLFLNVKMWTQASIEQRDAWEYSFQRSTQCWNRQVTQSQMLQNREFIFTGSSYLQYWFVWGMRQDFRDLFRSSWIIRWSLCRELKTKVTINSLQILVNLVDNNRIFTQKLQDNILNLALDLVKLSLSQIANGSQRLVHFWIENHHDGISIRFAEKV